MTTPQHAELTAKGRLVGEIPANTMQIIADEIREHGYTLDHHASDEIRSSMGGGGLQVLWRDEALEAHLHGADDVKLHMIREGFLHFLDHADPSLADRVIWTGHRLIDKYPPNFRVGEVVSVKPHGKAYFRVKMKIDDVESFTAPAMHFRMWLPEPGCDPVWPYLSETGRTIWPGKSDGMHDPVYTFIAADAATGEIQFDVFRHEGGRVTEWCQSVQAGVQVGLSGPGGGRQPEQNWLLMGGDETSLPAIRRILERADAGTEGHVFIEIEGAHVIEEFPAPDGVIIEWLQRDKPGQLLDRMKAIPLAETDRHVWLATEKSQVQQARSYFRDEVGIAAQESYFSAYWTRGN
ncbi:siderophore-interacting protein [Qingshengfaniella alkalisoli]|uniref:Siderophore-interacting protein n=1 Tax=Qingshengfaniella alkalisoli TaxID=2599296 RepID=A0A5B8J1A3_9RHOB|nr:siderophore-interacting protein [Qingshengfaniella alkalisoli]QDY71674.1 siderophore-interacting protein [Qingshengfaniella alkalisoli]